MFFFSKNSWLMTNDSGSNCWKRRKRWSSIKKLDQLLTPVALSLFWAQGVDNPQRILDQVFHIFFFILTVKILQVVELSMVVSCPHSVDCSLKSVGGFVHHTIVSSGFGQTSFSHTNSEGIYVKNRKLLLIILRDLECCYAGSVEFWL